MRKHTSNLISEIRQELYLMETTRPNVIRSNLMQILASTGEILGAMGDKQMANRISSLARSIRNAHNLAGQS